MSSSRWGGSGRLFQALDELANITIDHNTAFHTGDVITGEGGPSPGFYYINNLSPNNEYGVGGTGTYGNPMLTLNSFFPGAVFRRNILHGGNASNYPPDNFFPASINDVGFVNLAGGNYRLQTSSPYKNAGTDGKDVGADIAAINAKTAGVVNGTGPGDPPPPPPPPPPDTTPPAVNITAPADGATVSGVTTISANATDDVGVAGVQFRVDGLNQGAEDTTAPYSMSWDTTATSNGPHTLTAVARDAAGNSKTSDPVDVTVDNAPPPPPPPPPGTQSPYKGTPFPAPGQFAGEDFDNGGEGVAYHDLIAGNSGGLYRPNEAVDIISPYANGFVVNNFQTGEWLEYTINVSTSGTYGVEALVSSAFTTTARFHIEIDGADVTGVIDVPNTGSWGTFQWVGKQGILLTGGQHILRIFANQEYFNLDAIRISASSQIPFPPLPPPLPGQFEAEDFDKGGEAVAYHDLSTGNLGGLYRLDEDVDIISPYANGHAVTNFHTGEWLEYTVDVTQAGAYKLQALVSSTSTTGKFHMEVDGTDVTGVINVPNTGTLSAFQWVGKDGINLTSGPHILRMFADAQYFNLDAIRVLASQTPYPPSPASVPGQFAAEDFDEGGEGIAYHDLVAGNAGGLYRPNEDVDIISPYAGGHVVNNFQTDEWLEYTIHVTQAGTYKVEALVSTTFTTSRFHMEVDGTDVTGLIAVPSTGSWGTFQWVGKTGVSLTAGQHVLRIYANAQYFNLDAIRIIQ